MKYNIHINQFAVINNGLNLDIVDLAIYDFVKYLGNSPKTIRTKNEEGKEFFRVNYKTIIEQMPILGLGKQSIQRRLDKLVSEGLLVKYIQEGNRTFFSFGKKYDLLEINEQKTTKKEDDKTDEYSEWGSSQMTRGVVANDEGGSSKGLPIEYINNIYYKNNSSSGNFENENLNNNSDTTEQTKTTTATTEKKSKDFSEYNKKLLEETLQTIEHKESIRYVFYSHCIARHKILKGKLNMQLLEERIITTARRISNNKAFLQELIKMIDYYYEVGKNIRLLSNTINNWFDKYISNIEKE